MADLNRTDHNFSPHPRNARIVLALDHLTIGDLEWLTRTARDAECGSEEHISLDVDRNGRPTGLVLELSHDMPDDRF